MTWTWMIGIIAGYGEAIWEESDGKVRRITKPIMTKEGLALMKPLYSLAGVEEAPEFNAEDIVVLGVPAKEELSSEAARIWSGGVIAPVNGARIKIE